MEGSVSAEVFTSSGSEFITANANPAENYKALQFWLFPRPDTAIGVSVRTLEKNGGGSHRPPRTIPSDAGRLAARERHAYSLALNSTWNLRGSLTEAVYGTPTAADRLLRPDT